MKKKIKILSISILVVLVLGLFFYFGGVSQTFFGEFGWIPYSQFSDQYTDNQGYNGNFVYNSRGTQMDSTGVFNSKFWSMTHTTNMNYNPVSGGDNAASFIVYARVWDTRGLDIKFNENLYKKHFKVDYSAIGTLSGASGVGGAGVGLTGPCGFNMGATSSGTIEYIPSILKDSSTIMINGLKACEVDTSNKELYFHIYPSTTYSTEQITLINPRYKPLFDCVVDNDEVLIFDEFSAGSTIDISTLSYPVQKFCVNQPVVIRSFTDRGITTDTNNEILLKLSEGGSITVPTEQTIRIPYITKSQEGLLRCSAAQAFNTVTKTCEDILSEGLPDLPAISIIPISAGENEVAYLQTKNTQPLILGLDSFQISAPTYSGVCSQKYTDAPNPDKSFWSSTINNEKFILGSTYNINQYVAIEFASLSAFAVNGLMDNIQYSCTIPSDYWAANYKATLNPEGLTILTTDTVSDSKIADTKMLRATVNNQLVNANGGVKLRINNKIVQSISEEFIPKQLSIGENNIDIPLKTSMLGDVEIEILPYVEIDNIKRFGSNSIVVNYRVENIEPTIVNVTNYANITNTVYVDRPVITDVSLSEKTQISNTILYWVFGSIIFLLILIIIFIKRRK